MKTSAKPVLFISIVCIFLFGGIILGNVMAKLSCDKIKKEILIAQELLAAKKNTQIKLQAELQNWCSEEKIAEAAANLNLVKMIDKPVVMNVEKIKIEQVEKVISGSNE